MYMKSQKDPPSDRPLPGALQRLAAEVAGAAGGALRPRPSARPPAVKLGGPDKEPLSISALFGLFKGT